MDRKLATAAVLAAALAAGTAGAQTNPPEQGEPPPPRPGNGAVTGAAAPEAGAAAEGELLTTAQLEKLVAPVALYPDTLLIQILVGATQPLDVVKAEKFLEDNVGTDAAALKPEIEAQDWDPSVEVLATAFPEVISDMATHIEWTETMGDAMLAQSDDVLAAVQVMRQQAINSGALVSGPQQTVTTEPAAAATDGGGGGGGGDVVVITPTNPQTVYVPQYAAQEVYPDTFGLDVADVLVGGAVAFGTVALIDEIFDDDDDWDNYWGCRDCGGWDGRPIVRDPNVDIDVNGDVILGDRQLDFERGDRDLTIDGRPVGWTPDPARRDEARAKISEKRGAGGAGPAIERPAGRSDALREKLSAQTGAADISRPGLAEGRGEGLGEGLGGAGLAAGAGAAVGAGLANRPPVSRGTADRPVVDRGDGKAQAKAAAIRDTKASGAQRDRPAARTGGQGGAAAKQAVTKRPAAAARPGTLKADSAKLRPSGGQAINRNASAARTHAAANRGKQIKAGGGGGRAKRR